MFTKMIILGLFLFSSISYGAIQNISCQAEVEGIGFVQGEGLNINAARSVASEQCLDKKVALFTDKDLFPNEDESKDLMDTCINIRCQ